MSIKDKLKAGGSKAMRCALAGVVAVGLMPLPAFAGDLTTTATSLSTQMSADGYVIAAAYAAAEPAPELLGLNNPNFRNTGEVDDIAVMFGDNTVNENVDPYVYNYKNGLTPGVAIGGRGGGPMAALNNYDTSDSQAEQNAVWAYTPHIILGTGSDTIPPNEADYYKTQARVVEQNLGLEANSYNPIGVTYNRNTLPTMIETMYRLAKAANTVKAADSSLKTRYDDPLEIAKDYERYVVGAKGVVKQAIDSGKVKEKTIALVQSYDSSANAYTIITDGTAEGTATTNRYLEAVQGVAKNYYNTVGASAANKVTAAQLKSNVDVLIIGSNVGSSTNTLIGQLATDGLIAKTFYCTDWGKGSVFGTTVNSVENAQNIGRILPCVYPEVLDQSDMIAYYYKTFYHIKDGSVADMIAEQMDGVRNWDHTDSTAYTTWETTDVAGFDIAKTENLLKSGISYLNSQSNLSSYLTPTTNLTTDTASLSDATVTVPAGILKNGAAMPEPTVVYGGATLVKDRDYTLAYRNNTAAGSKGTVNITAKSGSGYTGSTSAQFTILNAEDISDSTATITLSSETAVFTNAAIEPAVTVAVGGATLVKDRDYTVSYANNKNVGTATVTVEGIGDHAGTATKTFTITKSSPTISVEATQTKNYGTAEFSLGATIDAYDGALTYTSSDTTVATVNGIGMVGMKKPGTTTITISGSATDNSNAPAPATVTLTVNKLASQTITVDGVTTGDDTIRMQVGSSELPIGATTDGGGKLSYAFADEKVAKEGEADNRGKKVAGIKAVGVGTTTLTITAAATDEAGAGTKVITIVVRKGTPTITAAEQSVALGSTSTFAATASTGYDGALSYESSNPAVAEINPTTGAVTPKALGETTITVSGTSTDNFNKPKSATAKLTVTKAVQTITPSASQKSVAMGKTVTVTGKTSGNGTISYSSSDSKIFKVSSKGVVTPVKVGTANLVITASETASCQKQTLSIPITVTQGTQKVTFVKTQNSNPKKVKAGKSVKLSKKASAKTTVTYSISKVNKSKKKFSINKKTGAITVAKGTASGTYKVTVKATAAKTANWKAANATSTVTVKVS